MSPQAAVRSRMAHRPTGIAAELDIGRRQAAESANGALQGAFVDIGRGFMRVIGRIKTTVLLGFTIAAYNTDRIRAFRIKHRIESGEGPEVGFSASMIRR